VTSGVGSTDPLGSGGAGFADGGAGNWEPVIGLEIHVQLNTRTKMFCSCPSGFGGEPNTQTCPVCLAYPGALPVPNERAIEWTIKLGHALGCEIAQRALFHRKNYFYPDNPKGYQISQYDVPLCANGAFTVPGRDGDRTVGIIRAHLEEDAAKTIHVGGASGRIGGAAHSNVDFNRGGTPLVEIVTQPDIRSADEAKRFLQLLRQTVVELGVSDAEMEKGTLRVDANVSVRERGETGFRTRTELKNMNSFNFVARGIEAEIARQIGVWESGGEVVQQTLDFDAGSGRLTPRRAKEEADDYRYFPEPDLVPVEPPRALVERVRAEVPEPPGLRLRRLEAELGFDLAEGLVTSGRDALYARTPGERRAVANVVMNELAATGVDPARVDGDELGKLIEARSRIPRAAFVEALTASGEPGFSAEKYLGDGVVADAAELEPLVERILDSNPGQVAAYRGGKEGLLGFFVGQVMKETQGKADPKVVNALLREKLRA
jgi:aspartyl-tRNA(Asn)/glutamyl-tRNA(Gln) amidotransferase subunit B